MKIYCILCDGAPLTPERLTLLGTRNFDVKPQISNSFTTTSVISLLTGKMPSEIIEGGVGYKPHRLMCDDPHNTPWEEIQEKPWHTQNLFHILKEEGWGINLHNALWFQRVMYNHPELKLTTSHPGGQKGESGPQGWDALGPMTAAPDQHKEAIKTYLRQEKEAVENMQKQEGNQIYFIKYHSYHASFNNGNTGFETAETLMNEVLSYWDTDEEGALFWIFSDHGNFNYIEKYCICPHAWYTWAAFKDNMKGEKIKTNSQIIGIGDFFPTIIKRLGLSKQWVGESTFRALDEPEDKSRLFYVEDSRSYSPDPTRSTTASVLQPHYTKNVNERLVSQLSFYAPENSYKYVLHNLATGNIKEIEKVPYNLLEALKAKFNWG